MLIYSVHRAQVNGQASIKGKALLLLVNSFNALKEILSGHGQRKISFRSCLLAESRCAFAARGLEEDPGINVDSAIVVFPNVSLNTCNGYDVTTGKPLPVFEKGWATCNKIMHEQSVEKLEIMIQLLILFEETSQPSILRKFQGGPMSHNIFSCGQFLLLGMYLLSGNT